MLGMGTRAAADVEYAELATPQSVRALLPESERAVFDSEIAEAFAAAQQRGELTPLQSTLRMWAGIATTLATGEPPAGTVTWEAFRQHLGV